MLKHGTQVRVTKLINFEGNYAEYIHNGIIYECRRVRGYWFITFNYKYA